jgi:hypothetical protein
MTAAIVRQTLRLHTIDEWLRLDAPLRVEVLRNIKLKDRLYYHLQAKSKSGRPTQPFWKVCSECQGAGHVLVEPRYDGIHPSQLPHPCMLKIFNEMIGIQQEDKHESRTLLIFDVGTAVHKMFQAYGDAGAWGPMYRKEAPISGEFQELAEALMIEGSADAENILIIEEIPGVIVELGLVHEYKTINKDGFDKLTRPKPDHKTQAMVYSAALNRPVVVYMYLNKNDSNLADFPVPFEHDLWTAINNKTSTLVQHYDRWLVDLAEGRPGTPPEATAGFHCKDCGFSRNCAPYKEHLKQRR